MCLWFWPCWEMYAPLMDDFHAEMLFSGWYFVQLWLHIKMLTSNELLDSLIQPGKLIKDISNPTEKMTNSEKCYSKKCIDIVMYSICQITTNDTHTQTNDGTRKCCTATARSWNCYKSDRDSFTVLLAGCWLSIKGGEEWQRLLCSKVAEAIWQNKRLLSHGAYQLGADRFTPRRHLTGKMAKMPQWLSQTTVKTESCVRVVFVLPHFLFISPCRIALEFLEKIEMFLSPKT